ncbi:siroheme synthase [Leptospira perolatii]|uniref:precorrin-2 dehydrogenase n=1 Tax=Leptospira perolatii TaxID=2023191 RepID=A0A2M9ZRH7_9LEPT|nr:bifunctional precorrin-2 dehydrogenase/sirohydrochlorin ferrochelatase [Leptospira perolatii]PJZ71165.1 siroheme synthase [Leptospira perolatii]PJZ74698.1 siroheme synthase [Leptospira perolatii]
MNQLLPVFLKLENKKVLLIGGGSVALEKFMALLGTGCVLVLLSKEVLPEIRKLAVDNSKVTIIQKEVELSDLEDYDLIYSATNNKELNHLLTNYAHEKGIWVNCVDDPSLCDFYSAATLDRGPVRIAVSTQGEFAGLAGTIKSILEELLPKEHDSEMEELVELRKSVKQKLGDPEERKFALRTLLKDFKSKYLRHS